MFLPPILLAQNVDPGPPTRAAQIEGQRLEKTADLHRERPIKAERHYTQITKVMKESPVKIMSGGLGPGAGFAIGSLFEWQNRDDSLRSKLYGSVSINRFYVVGTGIEFHNIAGERLNLSVDALHRDSPRLNYYGSGPDSSKGDRTNYRKEETLFDLRLTSDAHDHVRPTCGVGELLINVGPGTNDSLAQTAAVFTPEQAPGIDQQSNYLLAGCSLAFDYRQTPGDPRKGAYAFLGYERYHAQDGNQFSFHRVYATAEQYIPFLNRKRVIALRQSTTLSYHDTDQVVPFYLQATLGSDADLRGFRRDRFYDENSIVFNAEYRWEITSGFDMAVFGDAGKVFDRPWNISLSDLETSAGFGFRFKNRERVTVRLDTGFSREGVRVWLKFGTIF
jgi:hypothetical protein